MPSYPAVIFAPEFIEPIVQGRKTVTRRPALGQPCPHRVGSIQKLQPGQGQPALGRMQILSIRIEKLREVTAAEARREGYRGRDPRSSFLASFRARYATKMLDPVYRIEFCYLPAS